MQEKLSNPFTSGQIKNYLLFYASIVVIMILFFIASNLFFDIQQQDKKVFNTEISVEDVQKAEEEKTPKEEKEPSQFKLLEKAY